MPKCNDCGNTKSFVVAYLGYDVLFFDEDGRNYDSESIDRSRATGRAPSCNLCLSTNVEGDGEF